MSKAIPVPGTTCFSEQQKYGVPCEKSACRQWHDYAESQNCILLLANEGPRTLQDIGDLFGVTRMRICQVEKMIFKKLLSKSSKNKSGIELLHPTK